MCYLNTKASGHMICEKALFYELDETYKGKVKFGDNSRISIEGKGTILLNSWDNSHITLKKILFTPSSRAYIPNLTRLDEERLQYSLEKWYSYHSWLEWFSFQKISKKLK